MGLFAQTILNNLFDTGTEVYKLNLSLRRFIEDNYELLRLVMSGREVFVPDFLELYNKKIYDIHSKQNDIKYMKDLDFEGIYCIKNQTKKKYYVGRGDKVFRKVNRHFTGYGNQEIFADYDSNDKFFVKFGKLYGSGYSNLNDFEKETKKIFSSEFGGYQYYGIFSTKQTNAEYGTLDNEPKKNDDSKVVIEEKCHKPKRKRRKTFWLTRKRIALDVPIAEFVGKMYMDVRGRLIENGFTNIETVPVKDIYTESHYVPGEVEKIIIDKKYVGERGEMIPHDEKILIVYHLKRELDFPYSSRQVRKLNCKTLLIDLRNNGFTNINLIPIKDLKCGWLVKEESVEKVSLNRQEKYKKDLVIDYDTEIEIFYHTFK